jgi:excisionase family DNA binding protein
MQEVEALWTVDDLCTILKIARSTAYEWTHQARIPHVKLNGGTVRFRPSEVMEWVNQQRKPGRLSRVPKVEV